MRPVLILRMLKCACSNVHQRWICHCKTSDKNIRRHEVRDIASNKYYTSHSVTVKKSGIGYKNVKNIFLLHGHSWIVEKRVRDRDCQ